MFSQAYHEYQSKSHKIDSTWANRVTHVANWLLLIGKMYGSLWSIIQGVAVPGYSILQIIASSPYIPKILLHVAMCLPRPEVDIPSSVILYLPYYFFFFLRQVSLWAQNSLMRLHWLISKCRWSSCLHPPPAPTCYRAQLLHNVEDLNSCLQGYMLRTLSMETSPQSLSARFVLKIVLKFKST